MALTTCPECNGQVSTTAPHCPHCGYTPPAHAAEPASSGGMTVGDVLKWGLIGLLGLMAVSCLISVATVFDGDPHKDGVVETEEPEPEPVPELPSFTSAITYCKMLVEGQLKAPDSADFPWITSSELQIRNDGTWALESYVDATNGFGAEIRERWRCVLRPKKTTEGGYNPDAFEVVELRFL